MKQRKEYSFFGFSRPVYPVASSEWPSSSFSAQYVKCRLLIGTPGSFAVVRLRLESMKLTRLVNHCPYEPRVEL